MKDLHFTYDSVTELVEASRRPPRVPSNCWHEEDGSSRGWICADRPNIRTDRDALQELERQHFPQGVERIERMGADIEAPTPISVRRVPVRADQGDELDMQRVWNGELDTAWRAMRRQSRVGPSRVLVGVVVDAGGSTGADVLAWRGVAALTLAQRLSEAGHSVAIIATLRGKMQTKRAPNIVFDVTVKEAGEELDVHRAASLLASSLLFRGVMLNLICKVADERVGRGVGSPAAYTQDILERNVGYDHYALVSRGIGDAERASAWVQEHIRAIDARTNGEAA